MIRKDAEAGHLDVILRLQDVEDSLQAVLLGDLVEGVGHLAVELDQVRQGAVPQARDALGRKRDDMMKDLQWTLPV